MFFPFRTYVAPGVYLVQRVAGRLDATARSRVNEDLIAVGMDGNTYYESVGGALGEIGSALGRHGLEPDAVFSAHLFNQDSGRQQFPLAFSNEEDPFSPDSVENAELVVQWHKMQSGRYEIIAYVS